MGYLLKAAPMSDFVVLEKSLPLPGSSANTATANSSNSSPRMMKANSSYSVASASASDVEDADIEIDFENFYVNNFDLTIKKSNQQVFGDGTTALKFTAAANIKTTSDVSLVVQKDGLDRIFPMFTENGYTFEAILVFQSGDEGAMTAYCYAPSDKGNLYISDTVNVDIAATPVEDLHIEEDIKLDKPSLSSSDVRISATEGTAITAVTITATPVNSLKWSV